LKDAVGKNDSTLLSKESIQLLTTTLHNWGHTIRSLGSASESDTDDDVEGEPAGNADRNGGKASDGKADDSGTGDGWKAKDTDTEKEAAREDGLQVRCRCLGGQYTSVTIMAFQAHMWFVCAVGLGSLRLQLLSCFTHRCYAFVVCMCLQVRFLDVASAITTLARTAGEQLTVNLKKWSSAGVCLLWLHPMSLVLLLTWLVARSRCEQTLLAALVLLKA
jgi:hypothetical protein